MKEGEKLQFSSMDNLPLLSIFAILGAVIIFVCIKALVMHFAYGVHTEDRSSIAAILLGATMGLSLFLYFCNFILCRITITDTEISYRSLFASKTIRRSEIISAHGSTESGVRGTPARYTVKTENKKITINGFAFSSDQMRQMKRAIGFSSPTLQSRDYYHT
jgi:hypothetical protein